MAEVPVRAGWYPDPDGAAGQRWWNGAGWSDSRQGETASATLPPPSATPPVVYSAENPAPQLPGQAVRPRSAITVNARVNPMAFYGFVTGVISLFFNLFLVPGILAVVFSVRGLAKARQLQAAGESTTLRSLAILGLVLGLVGDGIAIVQFVLFLLGFVGSLTFTAS